jgi:hypothetical protein
MKKLVFLSVLSLLFANQGATLANNSNNVMISDRDFTQLTCSYLNQTSDKQKAVTEVLAVTETVITDEQKQTLEDLMTNKILVNDFCQGVQL